MLSQGSAKMHFYNTSSQLRTWQRDELYLLYERMKGKNEKLKVPTGGCGMFVNRALCWLPDFHILMQSTQLLIMGCSHGAACAVVFLANAWGEQCELSPSTMLWVHDWASALWNKNRCRNNISARSTSGTDRHALVKVFMVWGLIFGKQLSQMKWRELGMK